MIISGAIFDLDGTLIDSMAIWDDLAYNFLVSQGVTPKLDLRDKVSTMYLNESAQYVVDEYKLSCTPQDAKEYIENQIEDFYINTVPPKEDALDFLKMLKAKGVKMCVATATERKLAIPALERNGMIGFFDKVFSCADIGISKQSPEIFDKALEFLGTPKEETFVFEDSFHAVSTASKAGYNVIAIYDKSAEAQKDRIKKLSTRFIDKYADLNSFFE
ncbi:MAG: HAD family phosphatase [Clostridia bacterium]|nr:HAD family phosphatase [Clostridia bacterium]